jgi:hypothetical protein
VVRFSFLALAGGPEKRLGLNQRPINQFRLLGCRAESSNEKPKTKNQLPRKTSGLPTFAPLPPLTGRQTFL